MTLVLDTRADNFGTLYAAAEPKSSKNLEERRRRLSWATPVFQGDTKINYENYEQEKCNLKGKKKQQSEPSFKALPSFDKGTKGSQSVSLKPRIGKDGIAIENPQDSHDSTSGGAKQPSMFDSLRKGTFSKAIKFLYGFVKETKPNSKDKTAPEFSELLKKKVSIDSMGRESIQVPKEVVEQAIKDQTSSGLDLMGSNTKPSLRRTKPISIGRYDDDVSPPSSPETSNGSSDFSESSVHSLSVRLEANKSSKSIGKNATETSSKKLRSQSSKDKAKNRYMVNENGKIVQVDTKKEIKGCLKSQTSSPSSDSFKLSTIGNLKSFKSSSKEKKFRFNEFVVIFETYAMEEYDRRMAVRLEDNLSNTIAIKMELNEYKSKEMVVHFESRKYTHFLSI